MDQSELKWTEMNQNALNGLKCYVDMTQHERSNNKY